MNVGATVPIDPSVSIGHVHLKVADLERAIAFYQGVLGFEVTERWGKEAAFLSAGGYHHHIALNTWQSRGGAPPPHGATGLYHVAILYPTRAALGDALRRFLSAGVPLDGASDHGVSEALYLRDPDGNGVELYRDRPRVEWPRNPRACLPCQMARLPSTICLPNKLNQDSLMTAVAASTCDVCRRLTCRLETSLAGLYPLEID